MSLFAKLRSETHLPGFDGATGWLNSEPLTPEGLRGKVVLVDFWTYTCINWLRTLGYVRAWHEKYKDQGLVVVGVHTPEFPFEHDADNVRWAAKDERVEYPIALDPDYAVWRAFDNNYWPAVYIADAEGRIRHIPLRRGRIRGVRDGRPDAAARGRPRGRPRRPGLGRRRGVRGSGRLGDPGVARDATSATSRRRTSCPRMPPSSTSLRTSACRTGWSATSGRCRGTGRSGRGRAWLNEADGRLVFRFHARDVNLVMGPPACEAQSRSACSSTASLPATLTGST